MLLETIYGWIKPGESRGAKRVHDWGVGRLDLRNISIWDYESRVLILLPPTEGAASLILGRSKIRQPMLAAVRHLRWL